MRPLPVRIFHWLNLIALWGLISSGLQIYNANPVFGGREGFHFPGIFLLGGWLAGARNWHFTLMWFFGLNLLAYGLYILFDRRWQHYFVQKKDLAALAQSKNIQRRQFAWHRILYTIALPLLLLSLVSGLAMYQPSQLHWLARRLGDWQTLRTIHFLGVPILIGLAIVHGTNANRIGNGVLLRSIFSFKSPSSKSPSSKSQSSSNQ
jgi:thiosulfate reductase cytochrome b subunit